MSTDAGSVGHVSQAETMRFSGWFCLLLLFVGWSFFPLWGQSSLPAFRDGLHHYYPQFVWLEQCYQRGEYFPLWNASEGLGSSVIGQPSWQLLYPLRLIGMLPLLDPAQRLGLMIVVHLLLAAIGCYRLASQLHLAPTARWLAAISFSLSCPVLFQHTNLIYLCSAAWIGWALVPLVRMLEATAPRGSDHRSRAGSIARGLAEVAFFAGLMLLAGDPHTAVNLGLISMVALAATLYLRLRRPAQDSGSESLSTVSRCQAEPNTEGTQLPLHHFGEEGRQGGAVGSGMGSKLPWIGQSLAVVGWLAIMLLASIQALAAWQWSRHSGRTASPTVRTDSSHTVVAEILARAESNHRSRIFDFSLSPWNLPSLAWPTWGGHYQPRHSRWLDRLSGESRMWQPSLYLGLIPLLLALAVWPAAVRGRTGRSAAFMAWLSLLALLLALGSFSILWLLRGLLDVCGLGSWAKSLPSDAAGSLYGLLVYGLPGYASFRYPAKWTVWFVVGLAMLAAIQLDRVRWTPSARWISRPVPLGITLISLPVAVVGMIVPGGWPVDTWPVQAWLNESYDQLLGAADWQAVGRSLLFAFCWPLFVLCTWRLLRERFGPGMLPGLLVLLTLVDLSACGTHWITVTNPHELVDNASSLQPGDTCWANAAQASMTDFAAVVCPAARRLKLRCSVPSCWKARPPAANPTPARDGVD